MGNTATAVTAWIAFGISVATFLWKFAETYIRWPRLGVVLRQHVIVTPGRESGHKDRFDIVVVNSGAEATTVSNVGIRSVDRSRNIDVQLERGQAEMISGPDLPARVEAHGSLIWTIEPELTNRFPRGTELVGYAHRFRTYHKYPSSRRNSIQEYETPIKYTKN